MLESDVEEQDLLADWAQTLYTERFRSDNVSTTSDTVPLLPTTHNILGREATSSEKRQTDDRYGTKRAADTYEVESDTSATSTEKQKLSSPKKAKLLKGRQFFNLGNFFFEATEHVRMVAHLKLSYADALSEHRELHELKLLNTLVCLEDAEFKYLPLWAGGCDDDSGGVFNEDVAIPDVSFATAGPSIHHGAGMHTVSECDTVSLNGIPRGIATPTSSVPSSEYRLVNHDETSTRGPSSNRTTAGYFSDKLDPDQVYAVDSISGSSVTGDDYSIIARSEGMDPDDEEEHARREIAAMERAEAVAEAEVARVAEEAQITATDDDDEEDYASLFGDDEGDDEVGEGYASDDTMKDDDDDDNDDNGDDNDDLTGEGELM